MNTDLEYINYNQPTQWGPGIFRIECRKNKKTLFVKAPHSIKLEASDFLQDLEAGKCSNENLLKDFQTFGTDNFELLTVVMSLKLADPALMDFTFNQCRNNWPGPQY